MYVAELQNCIPKISERLADGDVVFGCRRGLEIQGKEPGRAPPALEAGWAWAFLSRGPGYKALFRPAKSNIRKVLASQIH